jgi:signal transduction histidine kinase
MSFAGFLRRHFLWVGLVAVLLPLVVLLAFQYRWLVKLDHTSAKAHEATLDNYLEAVGSEVEFHYRGMAERVLDLPAAIFTSGRLEKAAHYFKKKGSSEAGARRLFVVSFAGSEEESGAPRFFDPSCTSLTLPKWTPEVQAIYVAIAPWRIVAHKGVVVETVAPEVDERDPGHRLLLYPIADESSKIVGLAGMVLDESYFADVLLPRIVRKALPKFFPDGEEDPIVAVWDGKGRKVFASDREKKGSMEVEAAVPFVFTDWKIGLASRHATAAQVARRNFVVNIGLSAVLAAVLLGGILLALQTASRQMKLSQMKSDFVSNVSHELRTPLASIRVFGEFLRLGRVESADKVREYGEYIETESRRLTQFINNLLDFASIESGRNSYRFERSCLEEVVSETLKTFGVRLRQNGFRLTYEGPEAPLPAVYFDAGAIAQSLSNLLDNAVKYSNGGKEIAVGLRREGRWAVLWVRDQGIGIPRDEQAKIFERFHRVSTGLVHDVRGSGLGLSIVQHIVQAHHGRVAVESRPGEGSTFSIHLPIDLPDAAPADVLATSEA